MIKLHDFHSSCGLDSEYKVPTFTLLLVHIVGESPLNRCVDMSIVHNLVFMAHIMLLKKLLFVVL
jgi:hypothetical protein